MRIRLAIPDDIVGAPIIDAALEATTRANEALAHRGMLPSLVDEIRRGRVKWRPEGFGDGEHFDLGPVAANRGWGDCDDLGPWLAAELRHAGENATAYAKPSGPKKWHVVVNHNGQELDPSRWAGMGKNTPSRHVGVSGAFNRPMALEGRHAIAVMPHEGDWVARADLPWYGWHVSSHGRGRNADAAVSDALAGYSVVGEGCEEEIEVGLWGIPGTASVSFRDVVKVGVPLIVVATGGNPALAMAAQHWALYAYDHADEELNRPRADMVPQLMAAAVAAAKAGQGMVIEHKDGSKDIALQDGVRIHIDPDGTLHVNPPGYAGAPPPPPAPGQKPANPFATPIARGPVPGSAAASTDEETDYSSTDDEIPEGQAPAGTRPPPIVSGGLSDLEIGILRAWREGAEGPCEGCVGEDGQLFWLGGGGPTLMRV